MQRTYSIHSAWKSKITPMVFVFLLVPLSAASAEVYVPEHEYLGYFDANGIYTATGNVKNTNSFAIIPTITVPVSDGQQTYFKTVRHVPIAAGGEIPFKVKFPEIQGGSPVLLAASLEFVRTNHAPAPLQVLYDDTLVTHTDGHLTGRVQNTGDRTVYFPTIHAVVHGHNSPVDTTQNIKLIEKIEPGEIVGFSMYPDPAITEEILYYSCFAPVDTTVVPVTAKKNGGQFDFRYDSGAWFYAAQFDEKGTTVTMRGYNSYPLETYANFEFAPISGTEEFSVTVNGKPIEFIQSMDEMGFWHVAFSVGPTSQGVLEISGFEEGLPPKSLIPQWIRENAAWWADNRITDSEFFKGIEFLLEKQVIIVQDKAADDADQIVPSWIKDLAGWWSEGKISDENFVGAMTYLLERGIIRI